MKAFRILFPLLCFGLLFTLPLKNASADEYNKLTIFTFSAPVELPGVTLPAGTYTFKLADSMADRDIVQVFNKNMTKLYANLMAISDYRPEASDKTIIRFSETQPGAPPAVKEWFYPDDNYGLEFVYPRARARELAKASNRPVPSMPDEMKNNITANDKSLNQPGTKAMSSAQLEAEQPNGSEVPVSQAFETKPNQQAKNSSSHNVNTEAKTD